VVGDLVRAGTGTQALGGVGVVVTPTGGSALTTTATATAGGAAFSVGNVPSGVGGTVALTGLPSGCTAAAATPYTTLVAGGSVRANVTVTCSPPVPPPTTSATATLAVQFSAVTASSADLTVLIGTAACDPALNAACPTVRNFSSVLGSVALEGTAVARVTGRTALPTPAFGAAVLGGTLPNIVYVAASLSAPAGFTAVQPVASVRLTLAAGASGTLTTRSQLTDLGDTTGDAIVLVAGTTLTITEASTTIP